MSSRAAQLQPAVEQARQRSEDALAQLAAQQQLLAKAEQQLSELQRYRREYATAGAGALTVGSLVNRQNFLDRIDQAIVQQGVEIARLQRQYGQAQNRWHQAHARESALDNVVDRYHAEARRAEDRNEQAESDERTQYRRSR
ncbi:MAG: flagellar export protein FliJ [Xanthomonadaceae bacterium]|nr:flagellar export protein FliJ [Xanthomonadaceae bacterium]